MSFKKGNKVLKDSLFEFNALEDLPFIEREEIKKRK